jgi:hypothetical protein
MVTIPGSHHNIVRAGRIQRLAKTLGEAIERIKRDDL